MSDVDVAIVAYRGWDLTSSCLQHLRRQSIPHKVVVCDNGCDQRTAERLAAEYPEVLVLRMARNMPYAVACNAAVAAGKAELVVMMNNDVDARPDFLERLSAPFTGRARLGSVAALLLRPGERQIDSAGLVADRTLAGFPRFHGLPPRAALDGTDAGPALTGPAGAAAAFRRLAWEQVGGLDESIFAYLEDLDLALRLRAAGWQAALALDAVAVHVGSATLGHRSAEQRSKIGHARAYLLRRYGVLRSRAALRALATEAIVVTGDALLARDLQALAGRLRGWREAAGRPAPTHPPAEAIDARIGFLDSLRLRRGIYLTPTPARPRPLLPAARS
ncbi:MAG TPA: glycosyltransferase [Solirubrobacteraceae bacterium]|jgi:GT2 family glycosyltransferase